MISFDTPKSAVILAAGMGSRLRPLTDLRPKPLVEVNGIPILHNALRNLAEVGVESVTIVVGYRKDAIQYACGKRFSGLDISYVESNVYQQTGSAYSLWLARRALLQGDVFLLEGDVFFEQDSLVALMQTGSPDAAAISPFTEAMEGSAVLLDSEEMIREVRTKQTARDLASGTVPLFKTMNLFRLSSSTLGNRLVPLLDALIDEGRKTIYTEEMLEMLVRSNRIRIAGARCDAFRWYEIDSVDDLRIAEGIFNTTAALMASHPA